MGTLAIPEAGFWGPAASRSMERAGPAQLNLPRVLDGWNLGEAKAQGVVCPSCGHHVTIFVDTFAGSQSYLEDCSMCCHSIELKIEVREYQVKSVQAARPF
ncbi:MAG: CPXCG motif-containing cysteine-rich protein [Myxococcota bacterium]|nr:CPXCG motif-containing cysteine-rich protein [Myxococcota bacterium]